MKEKVRLRDALIEKIYYKMYDDEMIFFLSDDMGAPILDNLRRDFKDRFINVGIAEQNLINIATGLGLEGYTVYTYGIAPFYLRAYEQIRINLALSSQIRKINVNMIGVGTGVSYDVSGPTHHCLEDSIIMRTLPNIDVFSPCDAYTVTKFIEYSINTKRPKYIRLDGKPLSRIYKEETEFNWKKGFNEIFKGKNNCIISSGYMTHVALKIINELKKEIGDVGLIDVFMLKPLNKKLIYQAIKKYKRLVTLEEAFVGKGGLDTIILNILNERDADIKFKNFGFKDEYIFKYGDRDYLYRQHGFDEKTMINILREFFIRHN